MAGEIPNPSVIQETEISAGSSFMEKLTARQKQGFSVCVGLDSSFNKLPDMGRGSGTRIKGSTVFSFNAKIIDATAPITTAFKPNSAFYEELGAEGMTSLQNTIGYIRREHPEIPVILDAKRGDIGSTNDGYVKAAFDVLGADAITANPYLGQEAMRPFLDRGDKGILLLVKTSNPGAGELQDLPVSLRDLSDSHKNRFGDLSELRDITESDVVPFYQVVAFNLSRRWNENGNVGLVVGATYPQELAMIRKIVGDMPILIPGIGAQGGDLEATVAAGQDSRGAGMIINSSRGIIYASKGADFAQRAGEEANKLHEAINANRTLKF